MANYLGTTTDNNDNNIMMKTKLKTMIGTLRPNTGKGNRVQAKFTLRRIFAVCILAMVVLVGKAGSWATDHSTVTFDFSSYSTSFNFTQGETICKTIAGYDLYTMKDIYTSGETETFYHALDAMFAAQNVSQWQIQSDNNGSHYLYQGSSGYRYLSISNIFQNSIITINYSRAVDGNKTEVERSITAVDDSYVSQTLTEHVLVPNTPYTLSKDGPLDLYVPRYVKIHSITINYGSHHLLFKRNNENILYYKENIPYFRCQLSSRNFTEPEVLNSVTLTSYNVSTIETPSGYDPVVLQTTGETHTIVTPYDLMMNNEGVSQITASDGTYSDAYRLEVWDNDASTLITELKDGTNKVIGHKFQITSPGVLHNRTITIPGVEVKFSVQLSNGAEPNTTVAKYEDNHIVTYTNDQYGWWDRFPHNTYSEPTGGTFYTFTATAKGKLKFGGVKKGASGKVYLVRHNIWEQALLFEGNQVIEGNSVSGPSGYLYNGNFPTINNDYFTISSDGIEMIPGVTYDLQGETNPGENRWAPYLLEWFSYELDNTLNVNKTFAVANRTGNQIGENGSYTASDVTIEGSSAVVGIYANNVWSSNSTSVKGSISSAKVRITDGHLEFYDIHFSESDIHKMGGAIKVRIRTEETNYCSVLKTSDANIVIQPCVKFS